MWYIAIATTTLLIKKSNDYHYKLLVACNHYNVALIATCYNPTLPVVHTQNITVLFRLNFSLSTAKACFHLRSKEHWYCQHTINSMTFLLFKRKSDESFYNVSTNFQWTEFFFSRTLSGFFQGYLLLLFTLPISKVLETEVVTIIFSMHFWRLIFRIWSVLFLWFIYFTYYTLYYLYQFACSNCLNSFSKWIVL